MSKRAVAIHGHFYQPSREDPSTGIIPREDGAFPYHDWNERVHDQCYRPNAELGNFERISFDIGPTLFNWMLSHDPMTVSRIVNQERRNFEQFGVGNGMAQPYHHTLLPLAGCTIKERRCCGASPISNTRFGHAPAGMWLPEAAVERTNAFGAGGGRNYFTFWLPGGDASEVDINQTYWVDLPGNRALRPCLR